MTVAELQKKLSGLDPKTSVVAYRETDEGMDMFEITDVSVAKGEPLRHENTRKAGFRFDSKGPATWLFISLEDA